MRPGVFSIYDKWELSGGGIGFERDGAVPTPWSYTSRPPKWAW